MDELQSHLLEWQENVPESEESRDQVREEKSAMALRMAQIEEEREGKLFCSRLNYNLSIYLYIYDAHTHLMYVCCTSD